MVLFWGYSPLSPKKHQGGITINPGKQFEADFKNSIPEDVYYNRIPDPSQSFGGGSALRFSPNNPYDCYLFKYPILLCLELKSKQTPSLTYWREDFETDTRGGAGFDIKKHQIEGLRAAGKHKGIAAGFVLNFRKTNNTYYFPIQRFDELTSGSTKKSINETEVSKSGGILIEQELKRTRYRYNVAKFIQEIKEIML